MEMIKGMVRRDLGVHLFAASALVAGALGFEVLPDLVSPVETAHPPLFASAAPASALPLRGAPAARLVSAAPLVSAKPAPKPLGLDEFIGLAKRAAPKPLAKKFADEFVGEAALQGALVDFRREQGGSAPAADFLQKVAKLPEFGDLLGKFRSEPGFRGAFLALSQEPRAGAALRSVASLPSPEAAAKKAERKQGHRVAPQRVAGHKGLSTEAASSASRVGASPAPTSSSASSGASNAPGVSTIPSGTVSDTSSSGFGPRNATPSPGVPSTGKTHELGDLSRLDTVDRTRDSGGFLESLFATASPELRAALDYQCEANNICNPIEACVAAGMYDQCLAACRANVRCTGLLPDAPPQSVTDKYAKKETAGPGEIGDDKTPGDLKGKDKDGGFKLPKIADLEKFKAQAAETGWQKFLSAYDRGLGSALGWLVGRVWEGDDGAAKGAKIGGEIGAQIGLEIAKVHEKVVEVTGNVVREIIKGAGGLLGAEIAFVGSLLTGGGLADAGRAAPTGWDIGRSVAGTVVDAVGGFAGSVGGFIGGLFH